MVASREHSTELYADSLLNVICHTRPINLPAQFPNRSSLDVSMPLCYMCRGINPANAFATIKRKPQPPLQLTNSPVSPMDDAEKAGETKNTNRTEKYSVLADGNQADLRLSPFDDDLDFGDSGNLTIVPYTLEEGTPCPAPRFSFASGSWLIV